MPHAPAPLPPGPTSPAVWQLLRYSSAPLPFLEECGRLHGDPFTISLGSYGKLVMLADPVAVRDVFRGDPHALHSGEGNEFLAASVGDTSVLVLDDEPHARQRRIQVPPLRGDRMRSFFDAMQAETLDALRAWPVGQPVAMLESMRRITARVILRAVLGLGAGAELEEFEGKVNRVLGAGRSRNALLMIQAFPVRLLKKVRWLPFFRQLRELDDAIYAFVAGRRREARGENMLADLLAAAHEDGTPLTDQEIRDAVVTMLFAGHETTSLALAWALEQIVPRGDVTTCIVDELRRVTGGPPPRADQLNDLVYLDAVIRESMRVRTIFPFVVRKTKQAFTAGGREYPPGILLCPCNHLVHRRTDLYPEPETFRPERFLERKFAAYEWFPFGGGNRVCLGMAFALYEMKVVLGTIFSRVKLARPAGARSNAVRRGLTLAPDDGVRLVVES